MGYLSDLGHKVEHAASKVNDVVNPTHWSVGGNSVANLSIGGHKVGAYLDPTSKKSSDAMQTIGTLGADYYTGGLASLANGWQSKGSQSQLKSPLGIAGQLGAGLAGAGIGSNTTGIPGSPLFGGGGAGTADTSVNPAAGMTETPLPAADGLGPTAEQLGGLGGAGDVSGAASGSGIGTAVKNYGPTALMALSALSQKKSQPTDAQNQQSGIASTQTAVGNDLIAKYNSGQLNPADNYNVAQWEQGQTEATKQYYAKAGLADSSMAQQAIAGVKQQAEAMRSQTLQSYLSSGMAALGSASNTLSPIISAQIAADQQAQQAQSQFFQTLGLMSIVA